MHPYDRVPEHRIHKVFRVEPRDESPSVEEVEHWSHREDQGEGYQNKKHLYYHNAKKPYPFVKDLDEFLFIFLSLFLEVSQNPKQPDPIVEHADGEYEVYEAIEAAEGLQELSINEVYVTLIYNQ